MVESFINDEKEFAHKIINSSSETIDIELQFKAYYV